MIYYRKRFGFRIAEVYFRCPEEYQNCAIRNYSNLYEPIELSGKESVISKRDGMTLITDLSYSEEELLQKCDSSIRNKVRRAKREGTECFAFESADLLQDQWSVVEKFERAYREMHREKGMPHADSRPYLRALASKACLVITTAQIEQKTVVWHCYVVGDQIARSLYSVSSFREFEDTAMRSAIASANKLLHYEDMLWFKSHGYITYDWGGFGQGEDVSGISEFKKGFGGQPQATYYAMTADRKWLLAAYSLYRKIRGAR